MNNNQEAAAVWLGVEELTPWPDNPRLNDDAVTAVADSIQRFGFSSPIIARKENRMIIAGHTRFKAAKLLGYKEVPVRLMDLSQDQSRLLALADNKIGELSLWDEDKLSEVIHSMNEEGLDLDGLGFSEEELDSLLKETDLDLEDSEEEALPELQEEVFSTVGTVYKLGPHRLICGDCRNPEIVRTLFKDSPKIQIAVTSPPYAAQRNYDQDSEFEPIKPDQFVEWFKPVQQNVKEFLADNGSWFVNIKEHCENGERVLYVKDLTLAHVRKWGWKFVDEYCWERHGMCGLYKGRFKNGWEPVFHFSLSAPSTFKFYPLEVGHKSEIIPVFSVESHFALTSDNYKSGPKPEHYEGIALPSNRIRGGHPGSTGHSAAYPVSLPEFFIKAFTDKKDIIFDPFMGSGSTLIAAARNNRTGYGCEISPKYCDLIRRRWTKYALENGEDPGEGGLE
tara:strand:+ start:6224 stop:7573 length:1350 start_codon:yes stop_codon:yes gene_type:complete